MALSLVWDSDLSFHAEGGPALNLASSSSDAYSPMQLLAHAIMGCMAMDVVHILKKGRHDLQGMRIEFDGVRAETHPKRYVSVHLIFNIQGNVPVDAVERAIALSKSTYCSVSNTLRPDLEFTTKVMISA
jgi:putative redox protein